MKSKPTLLFFFLLSLILHGQVRADHGGGAELTYEWVRDSTYRFYFRFYRDCNGAPAPPSFDLCYTNSCGLTPRRAMLSKAGTPENGQLIDPGCPGYPNRCINNNSSLPGYQSWLYTTELTLPARCDEWRFYVSVWARNPAGNINSNVNDQDLYIEARLNTRDAAGNSSPVFTVPPVPYVCMGVPVSYNNGATDPDGDSLYIRLIQPIGDNAFGSGRCDYIPYNIPFRSTAYNLTDNPLECGNSFHLDNITGAISYTPTLQQWAVLTILVEEYRQGKLIGSVMRDLQTIVMPCNIQQPQLHKDTAGITGAQWINNRIEVCAGSTMRFCYQVTSAGANPDLVASDNSSNALPGSRVSYSGQNSSQVDGCLTWEPTSLDTGWHIFTISVKDVVCTAPGITVAQTFTIPIYVYPGTTILQDTVVCSGTAVQLLAAGGQNFTWNVVPGGAPLSSLSCINCAAPIATPHMNTAYWVQSDMNSPHSCKNRDTVHIWMDTSNTVKISPESPLVLCAADSVQLSAAANGPNHRMNLTCGINNTPCNGSMDTATLARIIQFQTQHENFAPFDGRYPTQRMQVIYSREQLRNTADMQSGTIRKIMLHYAGINGAAVFEQVKILIGCSRKIGFSSNTNWETGLAEVYTAPTLSIASGWNEIEFDHPYDWDTTQGLVLEFCYSNSSSTTIATPAYYIPGSGSNTIIKNYQATTGNACTQPAANSNRYTGIPEIRFIYCEAPQFPFSYAWSPVDGLSNTSTDTTMAYIKSPITYTVSTRGQNGCLVRDSISVIFGTGDFSVIPADTSICRGDQIQLQASGGVQYTWHENGFNIPEHLSCHNCAAPLAAPVNTTTYIVIAENAAGCSDTLPVRITVRPSPDITVLNNDTLVIYGTPVILRATGGVRYSWTPANAIDNPSVSTPTAYPAAPSFYVATGYGENGCSGKDSVFIDLDFRGRTFIPSAFTPNGDGINDVFRIANFTFQQLEAFYIFNRWGQEVFSTPDGTQGWDGTMNGVPQESGVYHYLIRLKFPDGGKEIYKGNVTLIR